MGQDEDDCVIKTKGIQTPPSILLIGGVLLRRQRHTDVTAVPVFPSLLSSVNLKTADWERSLPPPVRSSWQDGFTISRLEAGSLLPSFEPAHFQEEKK